MTSNGALLFFALATVSLFLPTRFVLPIFAAAPVLALMLCLSPGKSYRALRQAVLVTAPLFVFLVIVWVIVVRAAPASVLFVSDHVALTAIEYVSGVASRLLLFTLLVSGLVQYFAAAGAVSFIQALSFPPSVKALVLTTVSLKQTIAQAAQRAHTALVAARVLTAHASWLNVLQGWRLLQGVWMSTLSVALERHDTKWVLEGLPERFFVSRGHAGQTWSRQDLQWASLPALSYMLALVFG
jgi:hypothetical protein